MRTLVAGTRAAQRSPLALIPMSVEALGAGLLMAGGVLPSDGAAAAAASLFPLNLFFDVKHWTAAATSWPWWIVAVSLAVLLRGGVLAATLWLSDGRPAAFLRVLVRGIGLGAIGAIAFVPAAALLFAGVAIRYAPFIWAGGALGLIPTLLLCRRALALEPSGAAPSADRLPRPGSFLAYAYLLSAVAATMSVLNNIAQPLSATLIVTLGPVHALVFLGWRERRKTEDDGGTGGIFVTVTVLLVGALMVGTYLDRNVREIEPPDNVDTAGTLFLLGGADSTSRTGSMTQLDPRVLGFGETRTRLLSYRGDGERYGSSDTRRDLAVVARIVSDQLESVDLPAYLFGHSQAALILDRMMAQGLPLPDRSVVVAPPPPIPPSVAVPPPGRDGVGKPAGDLARLMAATFDRLGIPSYDIDVPASPVNLETVVVVDDRISRLAIWALGDSVWLDRDWRRPGELNAVVATDHVGAVNNPAAIELARRFLGGGDVVEDDLTWRSVMVNVLRYAFEPWRPG